MTFSQLPAGRQFMWHGWRYMKVPRMKLDGGEIIIAVSMDTGAPYFDHRDLDDACEITEVIMDSATAEILKPVLETENRTKTAVVRLTMAQSYGWLAYVRVPIGVTLEDLEGLAEQFQDMIKPEQYIASEPQKASAICTTIDPELANKNISYEADYPLESFWDIRALNPNET